MTGPKSARVRGEEEILECWQEVIDETGLALQYEPQARTMALETGSIARAALESSYPGFLSRFDFAFEWLTQLWVSMESHSRSTQDGTTSSLTPFSMLMAQAVNEALSVRCLVESGLGPPANILLRSFMETLFTILLLAARPSLVGEFMAAQTFDEARRFWQDHLGQRHLSRELGKIETEISAELPAELSAVLATWRESELERLSGFVHASSISAFLNYAPDSLDRDGNLGILGAPSQSRVFALREATHWIWYFALVLPPAFRLPRGPGMPAYFLDKNEEVDRWVAVAREVLVRLTARHWGDWDKLAHR